MHKKLSNKDYYSENEKKFSMGSYKRNIQVLKKQLSQQLKHMERVDIYNDEYEMFGLHSTRKISLETLTKKKYDGQLLLREIALFACAHQRSTSLFMVVSIFGKLSLPFVARYLTYGSLYLEWDGIIYTCFETISLSFFLLQNYFFITAGHIDLHRRYQMMMCVGALINPFKDNLETKYQLFPTINMACRESILAWFHLRNCVMDFGKKYMQRIFVYSSVFLGMYLFYAVGLLLSFFGII